MTPGQKTESFAVITRLLLMQGWAEDRYGNLVAPGGQTRLKPQANIIRLERKVRIVDKSEWLRSRSYKYDQRKSAVMGALSLHKASLQSAVG